MARLTPKKNPPPAKPSPSLRLPAELRNQIYGLLFCREQNDGEWAMKLVRVSKAVSAEAKAVFIKHSALVLLTSRTHGLHDVLVNFGLKSCRLPASSVS